jgi:chromosome segregation ATPase
MSVHNIVEGEDRNILELPDDVQSNLYLTGKAYYNGKNLHFDRHTRKVRELKAEESKLRSGAPMFGLKGKKISQEVQALMDDHKILEKQLDEMKGLISKVPELEYELQQRTAEYRALKAQNKQILNIVREVLDTTDYEESNDEMLAQLREAIHKCRENLQSQSEQNDTLLETLRAEVKLCNEGRTRQEAKILSLTSELDKSNDELEAMRLAILDAERQTLNCDDIKAVLDEKESEIQRIREELESLNSQHERLKRNLSQKSGGQDCSVYITQLTQLQQECEKKLEEQSVINRQVTDAIKEEMSTVQYLLEEMKAQNYNLLDINRTLKMRVKDCEVSSATIDNDMEILKLENANLLTKIDEMNAQIRQLKNQLENKEIEYEEAIFHEMREKEKVQKRVSNVQYRNEQLRQISEKLTEQNVELMKRLEFFSEHFCDLCGVNDEQKDQIADDLAQMSAQNELYMSQLLQVKF